MWIDATLRIIAAGPPTTVHCGILGTKHIRAVLRWDESTDPRFPYGITIQELTPHGDHVGFDAGASVTTNTYRGAMMEFGRLVATTHELGIGVHDYD